MDGCKGLVALGFEFPFADGLVKSSRMFYGGFEEGQVMTGIKRNAKLLESLFNIFVTFKVGGEILSWIPCAFHGADEFLDINAIKCSTI